MHENNHAKQMVEFRRSKALLVKGSDKTKERHCPTQQCFHTMNTPTQTQKCTRRSMQTNTHADKQTCKRAKLQKCTRATIQTCDSTMPSHNGVTTCKHTSTLETTQKANATNNTHMHTYDTKMHTWKQANKHTTPRLCRARCVPMLQSI